MRRAMTTGLIGLAILFGIARPASAQWNIIKWLEELSGPGYFVLYGGEVHVGCDLFRKANKELDTAARTGPAALRKLFCDQNPTAVGSSRVWEQTRLFLAVQGAVGTGSNPLEYPAGEKKDRTWAWTLGAGPVYRFGPVADVGTSLGVAHFAGSKVESTSKFVIEPYVVIRPLAKGPDNLKQYFSVRLSASMFPQGFTLQDFGATAGSLNGEAETVFQIAFVFNFAYLGWK